MTDYNIPLNPNSEIAHKKQCLIKIPKTSTVFKITQVLSVFLEAMGIIQCTICKSTRIASDPGFNPNTSPKFRTLRFSIIQIQLIIRQSTVSIM